MTWSRPLRAVAALLGAGLMLGALWVSSRAAVGEATITVATPDTLVVQPVPVAPPLRAEDFPDDVPPGAKHNGRRKPHPDDPVPVPPTEAEALAWRAELIDTLEETLDTCGYSFTLTCHGAACAGPAPTGVDTFLAALRRPDQQLQHFLSGTNACEAAQRELYAVGGLSSRKNPSTGQRCIRFSLPDSPYASADGVGLCAALLGERAPDIIYPRP